MSERPRRKNLQSFLATMAARGERGGFARAGTLRRTELSYAGTLALAGAAAEALRGQGVRPGDRVAILLPDGPHWCAAFAACLATGAVTVPLDPSGPEEFARGVISRAGVQVVLGDPSVRRIPFGGPAIDVPALGPGDAALLDPVADPSPSDLAEIVFTSGTTAAPRGVMITHGNLVAALEGIEEGITSRRRFLWPFTPVNMVCLVPLSHLFGQAMGFFIPAILGARAIFSPSRPPRALLDLAKRERAWVMILVPRHLAALREHAEGKVRPAAGRLPRRWWLRAPRSLPLVRDHGWRLRVFVVGGARLDPDLERYFKDLGYLVVQGYGLTETAPIISVSNPFEDRVGLLGKPSRAQEVRIAEDGEILVRGGNVTPGYFEDPEATKAAIEGGWLRTGDLGVIEPDGALRFAGRKKDLIVTGEGQNVFPDEVEEVLRRQEAIADCAVVAAPGERGEEVHAAIIPAAGAGGDPSRAREAVGAAVSAANDTLAPHQRVRRWSIWSDLDFPRTSTGKVLRRAVAAFLRERLAGSRAEGAEGSEGAKKAEQIDLHAAAGGGEEGPLAMLQKLAGSAARIDQRLGADLGLSSIDVAEIASEIEERYQVEIDPAKIHEDANLKDLLEDARSRSAHEERWTMPEWARTAPARAARGFIQTFVAFPLMRIFVRLASSGRENLAALRPPFLIAAGHASHFDVPVLLASMPRRVRRRVAVAMQPEYFEPYLLRKGSLPGRLVRGWQYGLVTFLLHTFPFPRSAAFRVALKYAGRLADEGWSILVFPEGELSRDGAIHEFRPGVGVLARDLRLPVLPARIRGAFEVIPRGARFPRTIRGPVGVAWGAPLRIESSEEPAAFATRLEAAIRSL